MTKTRLFLLTLAASLSVGLAYTGARTGHWTLPGVTPVRAQSAAPGAARPVTIGQLLVVPGKPQRRMNYLIAGVTPEYSGYHTKAPESFGGLADSIILAQMDPTSNTVRMLSLPRDTQMSRPDGRYVKLNAVIPTFGADGMVKVVENFSGLTLDGYLIVNLNAVRDLTDALGGIDVYVPKRMYYTDSAAKLSIDLQEGQQHLSGQQAEAFVRFRHDALGDIGRVQRQQTFIRAVAQRLLSPAGFAALPKVTKVLEADTRSNMDASDFSAALGMMRQRPRLETFMLPGNFKNEGGVSYWGVDGAGLQRLLGAHFTDAPEEGAVDRGELNVALVNTGASVPTLQAVRARLRDAGYGHVYVADVVGGDPARSAVLSQASPAVLRDVRGTLGFGEPRTSGEGVLGADVTVWVGEDATLPGEGAHE